MDYRRAIETMSPQVYERLKRAVELGKWPDGRALTPAQREHALQAVIAWGELHLEATDRVGFTRTRSTPACAEARPETLRWKARER